MKLFIFALPIWAITAQVTTDTANSDCTSTTTYPPITISTPPEGISRIYTITYSEFCPTGLAPKVYTITEPCHETQCQPYTAPPPDFTSATVVCHTCNSGQPMTEVLTFPIESASALSHSGYVINPTGSNTEPIQTQSTSGALTTSSPTVPSSLTSVPGSSNTPEVVVTAAAGLAFRVEYLIGTLTGFMVIAAIFA